MLRQGRPGQCSPSVSTKARTAQRAPPTPAAPPFCHPRPCRSLEALRRAGPRQQAAGAGGGAGGLRGDELAGRHNIAAGRGVGEGEVRMHTKGRGYGIKLVRLAHLHPRLLRVQAACGSPAQPCRRAGISSCSERNRKTGRKEGSGAPVLERGGAVCVGGGAGTRQLQQARARVDREGVWGGVGR